jgi:Antibiotic biosynthesis monooxygenase
VTRITLHATEPEDDAAGVLYRALRPDVDFRFVSVAEGDGYEVVREDGAPDTPGGVVLIDPFEVPAGEDDAFLAGWDAARAVLAQQQGYLGARLHRATGPAEFRFIDLARWSSPLMVQRAAAKGALYLPV